MSQGNRVIHPSDAWVKKIKHVKVCTTTHQQPWTQGGVNTAAFPQHYFTFSPSSTEKKTLWNVLPCRKMAQTPPSWALLIYLPLQMPAKSASPPSLSHEDAAGGREIFPLRKAVFVTGFLTWDFSITGLILSARKAIPFDWGTTRGHKHHLSLPSPSKPE